jgi:hypothetical protein
MSRQRQLFRNTGREVQLMSHMNIVNIWAFACLFLVMGYSATSSAEEKPLPETVPLENWDEAQNVYPNNTAQPAPAAVPQRKSREERRMEQRAIRDQRRARRREERPTSLVFGLSVAGSAICILPALVFSAYFGGFDDISVEVAYGIALGLSPISSTLMANITAKQSQSYDVPLGTMILSGYLGAAASYVALYFFRENDDPAVDGEYESIYFDKDDENESLDGFLGFLTLGLVPLLVPATCITIGYHWGRNKKSSGTSNENKKVAFTPPIPIVMKARETGRRTLGVRLVGGTF